MRYILIALVALFVLLQYKLWFETDGLPNVWHLQKSVDLQTAENSELKQRNEKIKGEIQDLKTNVEAIEDHARSDLGMIKKDEVYYQVVDK